MNRKFEYIEHVIFYVFRLALHGVAVSILLWAFYPIAKWYFDAKPLWGVDFYYTVSLVTFLKDNLGLPHNLWFYPWFGGWPFFLLSPFHLYSILPLTGYFDVVFSVKIWMMASTAVFLVGLYALCSRLSKFVGFGLLVAMAAAYSVGLYGGLTWGGSLLAYASQAFYPWVFFFLVWYLDTAKIRYLGLAAILSGISILGHPIVAIGYIYPTSGLLFLFTANRHFGFLSKRKILAFGTYLTISIFLAMPLLYRSFGTVSSGLVQKNIDSTKSTVTVPSKMDEGLVEFIRSQPHRIYKDNHSLLFVLLGLSAGLFLIRVFLLSKRRAALRRILPFAVIALYFVVYIWIFAYGISIYHGGWYRLFWSVSVWVGALASVLFGESIGEILHGFRHKMLKIVVELSVFVLLVSPGIILWNGFNSGFFERLVARSEYSSAFPGLLNLDKVEKNKLVPSWMAQDDWQYRYYDPNATINIWFNSYFKRPLARGYFDPPLTSQQRSFLFLTDSSLSSGEGKPQLSSAFGFPEEAAINNAYFFIDWNAIKYLGISNAYLGAPLPPKEVIDEKNIKNQKVLDFGQLYLPRGEALNYIEFADKFVSPVAQVVNQPAIAVFASDSGFETLMRIFAHLNLNSQKVIPVKMGREIDKFSQKELSNFGAIILYEYDYKNKKKVNKMLSEYVGRGGRVYVDTGSEIKDTASQELFDIFPVASTDRKGFGTSWDLEADKANPLTKDMKVKSFSPPVYEEAQWQISYSEEAKSGASAILKNKGKVVAAWWNLGQGKVIWTGLNLPYHVVRYNNSEEIKFFAMVMSELGNFEQKHGDSSQIKRISSQRLRISNPEGRGILFKEEFYDGWKAKSISGKKESSMKIYNAGPSHPGYMYVPLGQNKPDKVEIFYAGSRVFYVPLAFFAIALLWGLDLIIGVKVAPRLFKSLGRLFKRYVGGWWERENEE